MTKQAEIAGKILDYLATRPGAEDTLEGIMNWWTRSDKGKQGIDELEDALNSMVTSGDLERSVMKRDILAYKIKEKVRQ